MLDCGATGFPPQTLSIFQHITPLLRMSQKPNPAIIAWAQDLAAQGLDPNEMMKRLLKAGWLFDTALQVMLPHHPDWVARQQRRSAPAAAPTAAQRLHSALGIPKD